MQPHLSDTRQANCDFDQAFYRRLIEAKAHADLWDCRKIASRSKDEQILRALVAAMFASKTHRKEVSSCIREYIGKRAIPALLWNLDKLPPHQRMFQARLLCILGHWEAFAVYYRSMRELEPLDANTKKSVEWFMTNYTPALLPGLRSSLGSEDHAFILFCAPYLHKFHPLEVSTRLAEIARDATADLEARDKALHFLTAFSPEYAVSCLLDCGEDFPLAVLLSTLTQLAASEDGKPLLPTVLHDFLLRHDERRLAATLCSPRSDDEDRKLQFRWITEQLKKWVDAGAEAEVPRWVRHVAQQLCRADHPEWVSYLETTAKGGPREKFARSVLIASQHPAGLRLLLREIDAASKPEELYRPCIEALRAYRDDAIGVLNRVVATGNTKLRERIDQIVALTWPGKTIDKLLAERNVVCSPPDAREEPILPPEAPQFRMPRRKARTTASFERDRGIADEVKELEQYSCQVCGRRLVNARTGEPYAESHHVHPLGHGGSDTIDNLLCLCPLCHSLFHLGCVGIDSLLRIHVSGAATQERVFKQLRLASGRRISQETLRHHWSTLFIPPDDARFDEREPDED